MQRLQFDSVQESDVGVYICEATVEGFEPVTSYGRVDINSMSDGGNFMKVIICISSAGKFVFSFCSKQV